MIPTDQFIGLAEQTGLIKPLTEWVFNAAYDQCLLLCKRGIEINIAMNISSRNMQDTELQTLIKEKVKSCDVHMGLLEFELIESAIMNDTDGALKIMHHLRDFGVTFTIDDYGTGYSSLTYLKCLPVSTLKIDRSFVTHMATNKEDAAIVRSTIDLGHSLGLLVVAEGVEDKAAYKQSPRWAVMQLKGITCAGLFHRMPFIPG